MPKVSSSVGAHQSRIPGDIQSSTETEQADIERTPPRHRREALDQAKVICSLAPLDADFCEERNHDLTGGNDHGDIRIGARLQSGRLDLAARRKMRGFPPFAELQFIR
jgi:hypothetical protein